MVHDYLVDSNWVLWIIILYQDRKASREGGRGLREEDSSFEEILQLKSWTRNFFLLRSLSHPTSSPTNAMVRMSLFETQLGLQGYFRWIFSHQTWIKFNCIIPSRTSQNHNFPPLKESERSICSSFSFLFLELNAEAKVFDNSPVFESWIHQRDDTDWQIIVFLN